LDRDREKHSPAILAAQKRLEHLRCIHRATVSPHRWPPGTHGRSNFSPLGSPYSDKTVVTLAPPSLPVGAVTPDTAPAKLNIYDPTPSIKLYPDLAIGMLRQEVVATGRIWLLLKYLDRDGSGWISLSQARRQLAEEIGQWRICGKRQLRKLLSRGEGIFWRRDKERIWLRSTAKVSASLNVRLLTGSPVALPIADLLQGVGHVRAHFYASFHSGRNKESSKSIRSNLIARSTLQRLCHTSRRSQQRYEKMTGIVRQANIAIGEVSSIENDQRTAWNKGTAAFRFTDSAGKKGRKGVTYSAWQLPNKYSGPHTTLPKGKQKRINRELADLFMKGMTGNGKLSFSFDHGGDRLGVSEDNCTKRLYHNHSQSAAASYARSPHDDAYWPDRNRAVGAHLLWFHICGKEND
jgi:hypothetical protein